ncbi:hypothetical protein [Catenulispora acidiphila]|uniref:hypothetical protein n=1 Tax=Catenulispora acidiphila TaxID=304895 RepID=UPI001CBBC1C2|nr:hypothetical protein [Catenulispora acidiphila]
MVEGKGQAGLAFAQDRLVRLRELDPLDRPVLPDEQLLEEPLVDLPPHVARGAQVGLLAVACSL